MRHVTTLHTSTDKDAIAIRPEAFDRQATFRYLDTPRYFVVQAAQKNKGGLREKKGEARGKQTLCYSAEHRLSGTHIFILSLVAFTGRHRFDSTSACLPNTDSLSFSFALNFLASTITDWLVFWPPNPMSPPSSIRRGGHTKIAARSGRDEQPSPYRTRSCNTQASFVPRKTPSVDKTG